MRWKVVILVLAMLAGVSVFGASAGAAGCTAGSFEVSGTVTDAVTGLPLDRVTSVSIVLADGTPYDGEGTDLPASAFATCLPVGDYKIAFNADHYFSEWFDEASDQAFATIISVTDGPVTGVDATLQPWPTISGRITDSQTGEPLFTSVGITNADTGEGLDGEGTNLNGEFFYVVDPRFLPINVKISFAADYHWAEWYDDARRMSRATVISVTADSGHITGIDASLRPCRRPFPDFCIQGQFTR